MTLQNKLNFSETLLNSVIELRSHYVSRYGNHLHWTDDLKAIFLLNADSEIINLSRKKKIKIHSSAYDIGLGIGIYPIITENPLL
jgi:hypothetical protein